MFHKLIHKERVRSDVTHRPWTIASEFSSDEVFDRLTSSGGSVRPGGPSPVILQRADYETLYQKLRPDTPELLETLRDGAVRYENNIGILLPGPYAPCVGPVLEAGGRPIWDTVGRHR